MGRFLLGCKTEAKLEQSVARILGLVPRTRVLNISPRGTSSIGPTVNATCGGCKHASSRQHGRAATAG